ncbi:MAG TPA: helix-hairpin-helix domain-containing protein [Thermomicrobiales bacterium]
MANPTNAEIADLLERMGRLLEIGGESAFRFRAYLRAAETIRTHATPVAELARAGKLRTIPGIGEGIAGIIREYLDTGTVQSLEEIERKVPPTLLELTAIPGLGAKTAYRLYTELGIVDLAGLEAAVAGQRLRTLPGMSERTETKIAEGIAALRRRTGRHRLGTVLPLGRQLVAELEKELPPGTRVSLAGSVRRMLETVGDLDIVIGTDEPERVVNAIKQHPSVARVRELQGDSLTVETTNGVRADIYLSPTATYGTNLVRGTGSDAHLALLGALPESPSEEDLYERLGLPWIPPELRQGLDEIELARAGNLDSLITIQDIRGEFHSHTTWSDGALSVLEMAQAAEIHGYQFLGISDHTHSLGVARGLDVERLRQQRVEIDAANQEVGIRVFAGAEVEVARDGRLDFEDEVLAELDFAIASTHVGLRQPREVLTQRLIGVLENPNIDIIAHPSGRLIEQREGGDFDWEKVFATAARTGTILEINSDPARLDLDAAHARQALAAGCLLTINCDAHHPDHWALLEYGVAIARRAGATPDRVINCWPIDRIEAWLRSRGSSKQ